MLGEYPGKRLLWLFFAGMALTLVAAACGEDEAPPVDTAAIQAAVQAAVRQAIQAAPSASKEDIEALMVQATEQLC